MNSVVCSVSVSVMMALVMVVVVVVVEERASKEETQGQSQQPASNHCTIYTAYHRGETANKTQNHRQGDKRYNEMYWGCQQDISDLN